VPHIQPRHEPARAGDVKHSLADLTRARELLGYEPIVSLEDGLAQTMDWYRSEFASADRAANEA
jgi:nucleoside-diphosphate-sugar epimerase